MMTGTANPCEILINSQRYFFKRFRANLFSNNQKDFEYTSGFGPSEFSNVWK